MQLLGWLTALVLAGAVVAKEPPTELVIDTTFVPQDCTVKAKTGDNLEVHYTGTLFATGKKFDSSRDRGTPLPLKLGVGQVIKGWDDGLQGMCVGEKRILTIPASLAYGSREVGNLIPANSALVFDTELVHLDSKASKDEL
ncbi:hypothetical protein FA15DRAFT_628037 [Coprinopsis marcescibilis]|uniref:peptidylprolyl isomerase n=1 Tax=Coprinopsis marcescibilis TaxID=230819 RepID=A0A5C3KEE2_COPMA|nr:hypothetical protein FA15DRAFT_628037 [Coprinopsis marcescibilis]